MYYPKSFDRHGKGPIKPWMKWGVSVVGAAVIVAGIFLLGVAVGNGKVTLQHANAQNASLPKNLDYTSVQQLYDTLKANYDGTLTTTKLLDGLKTGLAQASGDPYTVYFNAKEAGDFNNQLQGTFSGIGAELGQDAQGNLVIVAPIDGFPASKSGIRPQDIITAIDGQNTAGMSVDAAVSKIRGPKGSQVVLKVIRNKTDSLSFTITRDDIKVPSVKWRMLDGGVGYIQINQFSDDTADLAQKAATDLKNQGVKSVVLDLRGNPGGLLDAAVRVSDLWLPEGKTIVQEKRGNTSVGTEMSNGIAPFLGVPTVVLIDAGSASASEITAGALHDNNAATLFGVKSFGKGSVQQIVPLSGGSEVKVTIARWYRPNGQNIDKKGIDPDHEVKMTDDDFKNKRDPQKDAAIQFLTQKR